MPTFYSIEEVAVIQETDETASIIGDGTLAFLPIETPIPGTGSKNPRVIDNKIETVESSREHTHRYTFRNFTIHMRITNHFTREFSPFVKDIQLETTRL